MAQGTINSVEDVEVALVVLIPLAMLSKALRLASVSHLRAFTPTKKRRPPRKQLQRREIAIPKTKLQPKAII
jgi:hypothetical protein